jgi:nucleotide-binding universal stress UspA family protein
VVDKETSRIKRILLPLDGSEAGEAALPYVEELAIITKAEVILLQVVTPHYDIALAEGYTSHLGRISEEYLTHASAAARDYLNSVKEKLAKMGITARSEVELGSPAERIVGYAKENNIDLIAMSTHGRSGIGRWLLGGVADKVIRAADRPVLLVRASAKPTTKEQT